MTEATAAEVAITAEPPYAPYLRYVSQIPKLHLALIALWAIAAVWLFFSIPIQAFSDSIAYREMALSPLLPFGDFFYNPRVPITLPLVIKLFFSDQSITAFQLLFFLSAWGALFLVISDTIKPAIISGLCIFFLAMVSLSWLFFFWNRTVITESISFSGVIFVLALVSRFIFSPNPSKLLVYSIVPVWVFWENSRDVDAYYSLSVALIFLVAFGFNSLLERGNKKWKTGTLLMGLVIGFSLLQISAASGRQGFNIINIIGQRILPYPDRTTAFEKLGMPMNDKVMCFKGKWMWDCNQDYSGFGDWIKTGKAEHAYILWLVEHPVAGFKDMANDFDIIWTDRADVAGIGSDTAIPPISALASIVGLPRHSFFLIFCGLSLAAFLTACFYIFKTRLRHWILAPAAFFISNAPLLFVCYNGDAGGIGRHCLPVQLNFYVTGWALIFWLISCFFKKQKAPALKE